MILVISTCKEKLHEYEFVKPITDILAKKDVEFKVVHYKKLQAEDLQDIEKIIICGTSLDDFAYFNEITKFDVLKEFSGAILGICAGMHVLVYLFGGRLYERGKNVLKRTEIGMRTVHFHKEFLGVKGNIESYELHQMGVGKVQGSEDDYATTDKGVQALKWGEKNKYGVLFHPEVRNKEMIQEFVKHG